MDPSNPQDDPPPSADNDGPNTTSTMPPSQDLADSLNRLSLANAAATPLPTSPSLLSPHDGPSRPVQPAPRRTPSSTSLRDERRKSIPALQKRSSTASLRSVSHNGPASPLADSSRRSSANFAGSPTTAASPAMWPPRRASATPELQAVTAASVAAEHFHKELDMHKVVDPKCKTVVLVHDACYGHRFERPRTNKKELSTIVERPERIRACVLGISAAYVRLGRRYGLDMHSSDAAPFRIRKTSRSLALSDSAVTSVHGTQWMVDLTNMCNSAESRLALNPQFRGAELVRPRDQQAENPEPAFHSGDLYLCSKSLNALEGALGGVCDGVDAVLGPGPASRAFVCIRPPGHHCSADFPSGFCWINNVHVGISYAAAKYGLTHAAILDFDLHHGDGSQDITWKHNAQVIQAKYNAAPYEKTAIGYYSLHDINSYPCEDGGVEKVSNACVCIDGAHGQSIWNVHLDTWETEDEFWDLYRDKYVALIDKARSFLCRQAKLHREIPNGPHPKAAIFISAGFDASEWESPGMQRHKVHVPTTFYAKFTADVVRMSQEEGLGVDGRVISVLEGGYSDRALTSGVFSHLAGLGSATANEAGRVQEAIELASRRGSVSPQDNPKRRSAQAEYDPKWWSPEQLDDLEGSVNKRSSTFFAPTRSSSAKVVTPTRDRKSQGSSYPGMDPTLYPSTEVGWVTAAHELCKALIPENRQTMSCRPEDLNLPASRQRYDRQAALDGIVDLSTIPPPPSVPGDDKRQLRVRKAKSPTPFSPRPATPRQQAMRKNRRKTIDGNDVPDPSRESSPSLDASRRKSATATTPLAMADLTADQGPSVNQTPREVPPRPASTSGARKTSGSRTGTPRRNTSPRKPPPVPKVPSAFLPSKLAENSTATDEVDNLAASVQKIKLVMPSPEEQMIREKKALDERKQSSKASKTPKSPRSPRKASATKSARGKSAGRPEKTPNNSPPILPTPTMGFSSTDVVKQEIQNRAVSSPLPSTTGSMESSAMDVMYPASKPQEWIPPSVSTSTEQQSVFALRASPPLTPDNLQTSQGAHLQSGVFSPPMSEAQTRTGLPVFTSNTPIPFAAQPLSVNKENAKTHSSNNTSGPAQHSTESHGFYRE